MTDRVPTPGKEGRVKITPESGSAFYATLEMADEPTQEGTPLNKATFLKDSTAELFGFIPETAVPDDAFAKCAGAIVPSGLICMWSGSASAIPTGWALCNGSNGTPNLSDRFIKSANNEGTDICTTGGSNTKTLLEANIPSHRHTIDYTANDKAETGSFITTQNLGSGYQTKYTNYTGSGTAFDIQPAYFVLAFIMKL